ncbi:MAG TPA: nucleotidyl transferase AbiEii/AbiGii toxin family protein, partial [Luteolibacter sp.]
AAVVLSTANSRMKDFFDLHWLSRHKSFHGDLLRESIEATFKRRSTEIPKATPVCFTAGFYSLPDKEIQWAGFLRKSKLEPLDFGATLRQIGEFLKPVMNDEVGNRTWRPETGWTESSS